MAAWLVFAGRSWPERALDSWGVHLERVLDTYGLMILLCLVLAAVLAVPLARLTQSRPALAGLLALSVLVAVSLTTVPAVSGDRSTGECLARVVLPNAATWWQARNFGMNVALFLPVGFFAVLLGSVGARIAAVGVALVMPLAIELTQLSLTHLGRQCQVEDVLANVAGAVLGVALGGVVLGVRWVVGSRSSPGVKAGFEGLNRR